MKKVEKGKMYIAAFMVIVKLVKKAVENGLKIFDYLWLIMHLNKCKGSARGDARPAQGQRKASGRAAGGQCKRRSRYGMPGQNHC